MTDSAARPEDKLKRERAGTYRTADGRFTVEQTSSGWLVFDGEQTDELGLPLARGPFATLGDARAAIGSARSGEAPIARIAERANGPSAAARPASARPSPARATPAQRSVSRALRPAKPGTRPTRPLQAPGPVQPARPPIVIREIRTVDGDALRALWSEVDFRGLGDDDRSLARLARRNPGLVLVAAEGSRIVGSALGAWDGRRGWIYHVATAPGFRRRGIATRLIGQIEAALANLGCPKANVMVRPDSDGGAEFWTARGYRPSDARQFGKELGES